jgi:nickel-dependent lactate racemase
MQTKLAFGQRSLELDVAADRLLLVRGNGHVDPVSDPARAVVDALDVPFAGYPSLRRSLTPDDRVTVVVDETLPRLVQLLRPVLDHLISAGVKAEAITLLCPPSTSRQAWVEDLPEALEEVRLEVHDPVDRKHLSYLAATKQGRRIYLNRTAVDADQVVVLAARRYDPLLGVSGAEGALFPDLIDEATHKELLDHLSPAAPDEADWPLRREAVEVAWLVGAPFLVQVIEGHGDDVAHVVGGTVEASAEGQRLLDAVWRRTVPERAETVVASVSGDPARVGFGDLARAAFAAARVVQPGGRIVLLTDAAPQMGPAGQLVRQAGDARQVLETIREQKPPDAVAVYLWAQAARQGRLHLLSRLDADTVEGLEAIPLADEDEARRSLRGAGSVAILEDAHKTLTRVAP